MKFKSILKWVIWRYQKVRLGEVGESANISILTDIRGDKKKITLGKSVTICKYASLEVDPSEKDQSRITIGDRTLISSFAMLRTYGGTIKIGHSCFINSFTILYGHGNLIIGNGCLIGPQVTIIPVNYGLQDRNIPFRMQTSTLKGIIIEDDVWIGAGATILDGCTIGKGSVIGAGFCSHEECGALFYCWWHTCQKDSRSRVSIIKFPANKLGKNERTKGD